MTKLEEILVDLAVAVVVAVIISVLISAPPHLAKADAPTLAESITRQLTITGPSGRQFPVIHCRIAGRRAEGDTGWDRCQRRVEAFVQYFQEAAERHGVDPWLLAAMAVRESGLNPYAVGPVGEVGIMQLHPLGVGRRVRFGRDPHFRTRCRRLPGACQSEVVDLGAQHLARAIQRCGSVLDGLGAYNSGRCGANNYALRVTRLLDKMRAPMEVEQLAFRR